MECTFPVRAAPLAKIPVEEIGTEQHDGGVVEPEIACHSGKQLAFLLR